MKKIISALILMLLVLSGCDQEEKLAFSGTIEATQTDMYSEVSGKILKVFKEEGETIEQGDIIAEVDSETAQIEVRKAEAGVKAAQAKLEELEAGSRDEQVQQAEAAVKIAKARLDELKAGSRQEQIIQGEAQVRQAEENLLAAQQNYAYRQKNLENLKNLKENKSASQQQVDDAENLLSTAKQQLANAREQKEIAIASLELLQKGATEEVIQGAQGAYEQAKANLQLVKEGATNETIKAAEANVEQMEATLDITKLQLKKYRIHSIIDGIVLYRNVDLGQWVSPGTAIATVQSTDDYWIKVYIPQKYQGKISLHQKVQITTTALPEEVIEGVVTFKSPEAEFTPRNVETTEAKEENTVFEVKVKALDHIEELSAGMTANVYID